MTISIRSVQTSASGGCAPYLLTSLPLLVTVAEVSWLHWLLKMLPLLLPLYPATARSAFWLLRLAGPALPVSPGLCSQATEPGFRSFRCPHSASVPHHCPMTIAISRRFPKLCSEERMFQTKAETLRASFLAFLLSLPGSGAIKGQEDGWVTWWE